MQPYLYASGVSDVRSQFVPPKNNISNTVVGRVRCQIKGINVFNNTVLGPSISKCGPVILF